MEKIIIKGLKIKANHGVLLQEKENGQLFILDMVAEIDVRKAQISDDLNHTVSYASMIKTATEVFTEQSYNLLECVANKVGTEILKEYPKLKSITVTVKKPDAPIDADFEYVAIEDTVTREQLIVGSME